MSRKVATGLTRRQWAHINIGLYALVLLATLTIVFFWRAAGYSPNYYLASAKRAVEVPPECHEVTIINLSGTGRTLYVKFCGTGSGGESPMQDWAHNLIVDGTRLSPFTCTRINPCIVLALNSPQS